MSNLNLENSNIENQANDKFMLTWRNLDLRINVAPQGKFFQKKSKQLHIINDVSGYAESGECLAIMGSSGAGKSTLLNILADRQPLDGNCKFQGVVSLNCQKLVWREFRNIIGFVMQKDIFNENLKIEEILKFVIDLLGQNKNQLEKKSMLNNLL